MSGIKIPKGWRRLRGNEKLKPGDKWMDLRHWRLTRWAGEYAFGAVYIRRIKK